MFTYDEAKPFQFQPCWYQKLEKDFFKQTHNNVDAIERASEIVVLKDFHNIFTAVEYEKIVRLFKSEGLVNLFLFVWNAYLFGRKVKVLNDIEFNINTISDTISLFDEEVLNIVKNMENEIKEHKK